MKEPTRIRSVMGFIQGRLSPMVASRIQAFPWTYWQDEFSLAQTLNFQSIEWTIDSHDFYRNPILTSVGQHEIITLKNRFDVEVPSVTCDYFMENPFWQQNPEVVFKNIKLILQGMEKVTSKILVIPLVDNASIQNLEDFNFSFFQSLHPLLEQTGCQIAFELDLSPDEVGSFISKFDEDMFGVNYDIGNSAALGYDPKREFEVYGWRITNVHVKDRILGGGSVPLGLGSANFSLVFSLLREMKYKGNFILQTARAEDGSHAKCLSDYRRFVEGFLLT